MDAYAILPGRNHGTAIEVFRRLGINSADELGQCFSTEALLPDPDHTRRCFSALREDTMKVRIERDDHSTACARHGHDRLIGCAGMPERADMLGLKPL